MKKASFTPAQIVEILQEVENGATAPDIRSKYGISENTLYEWRLRFYNFKGKELKRLQKLEAENQKLKALNKELTKDLDLAKEIIAKKLSSPGRKERLYRS